MKLEATPSLSESRFPGVRRPDLVLRLRKFLLTFSTYIAGEGSVAVLLLCIAVMLWLGIALIKARSRSRKARSSSVKVGAEARSGSQPRGLETPGSSLGNHSPAVTVRAVEQAAPRGGEHVSPAPGRKHRAAGRSSQGKQLQSDQNPILIRKGLPETGKCTHGIPKGEYCINCKLDEPWPLDGHRWRYGEWEDV